MKQLNIKMPPLLLCWISVMTYIVYVTPIKLNCKPRPGCNFNKCGYVPPEFMLLDGFDMQEYLIRNNYNIICNTKTNLKGQKGSRGSKGEKGDSGTEDSAEIEIILRKIEEMRTEQERTNHQLLKLQTRIETLMAADSSTGQVTSSPYEIYQQKVFQGGDHSEQLSSQCEHPKIETTCAPKCPRTCYDPKPTCDKEQCNENVKCVCPEYLVQEDSTNDTCISFQQCPGLCPVFSKTNCFFWEMKNWIDFFQAKEKCAEYGGHPANIFSKDHYNTLVQYIRETVGENTPIEVDIWIGMGYGTRTNKITLFGGYAGEKYVKWKTDAAWPLRSSDYQTWTHMVLSVNNNPKNEGMYNRDPTQAISSGVICEI